MGGEKNKWLLEAENDSGVRSEIPRGWYPDNNDPAKERYWNGRSWTNQIWDPATQEKKPSLPEDRVLAEAEKRKRLVEIEARLKLLDKQSREMMKEHMYLRETLETDFDPPHLRVQNQEAFYQLRLRQDAVRQETSLLEAERKKLRPGWKSTIENIGVVAAMAAFIAAIFAIGPG